MRKMRSLEQWRSIIEEQQASDLTITEFCLQHALSKTSFYAARSKLTAASGSFVRAKVTKHVDPTEQQQPIILAIGNVKVSLPSTMIDAGFSAGGGLESRRFCCARSRFCTRYWRAK